jgi:hypothetical protein
MAARLSDSSLGGRGDFVADKSRGRTSEGALPAGGGFLWGTPGFRAIYL